MATRYVTLDLETTGLGRTAKIVEICLAACQADDEGHVTILDKYLERINPGCPIPEAASLVHGIYDRHVEHSPPWSAIAKDVANFITKWTTPEDSDGPRDIWAAFDTAPKPSLVGHNIASYDIPILEVHFAESGMKMPTVNVVDTLKLARARWPKHPDGNKLITVAARLGINERNDCHGAEADVLVNADVYGRMLTGKEYEPTAESVAAKAKFEEKKAVVDDLFAGMDLS